MLDPAEPVVRVTVDHPDPPPRGAGRLAAAAEMVEQWLLLSPDYITAAFGSTLNVRVSTGSAAATTVRRNAAGIEVGLILEVEELRGSAGQIGSIIFSGIVSALGGSQAFQNPPIKFRKTFLPHDHVPPEPNLLEEVKDLQSGEMAILAKRDESLFAPDYRYELDLYLAEALSGQVRVIDGEGDLWRIRL